MISKTPLVGDPTDELQRLSLGDARLETRARQLVTALARNPAAGFPAAVHTSAEREATYRFLSNARVTLEGLLAPHVEQTVRRAVARPERPLVIVDKTAFVFGGESDREGLTRLGANRQGFDAFVALAVSPGREPLGVLAIQPEPGNCGRSTADAWYTMTSAAAASGLAPRRPIYVMDREADAYALFAALQAADRDFVVRVAADRWVQDQADAGEELLRTVVARTPVRVHRTVRLARRSGVGKPRETRRRHPSREGRDAMLVIRACPVTLPRPRRADAGPPTLRVHLIHVCEETPPLDMEPVEWLLVTTLPIDDPAAIGAIVDHYRARWTIEEYFKALKTGCKYEARQLETLPALLNALGLLAPLAWRLLALRSLATDPTVAAITVFDPDELHVLRQLAPDVPLPPTPTAKEALHALARLGGHFPQNGRPGWQVLWTGFHKLRDRVEGYRLARTEWLAKRRGSRTARTTTRHGNTRSRALQRYDQ
jgi:hypothetical protein